MCCTYSFREALCAVLTVLGRHCVMCYSFREALCDVLTVLGRHCELY